MASMRLTARARAGPGVSAPYIAPPMLKALQRQPLKRGNALVVVGALSLDAGLLARWGLGMAGGGTAAVERPPPPRTLRPGRPAQRVPAEERDAVAMALALTEMLAAGPGALTQADLAPRRAILVTTSDACADATRTPVAGSYDDFELSGDGTSAPPAAVVRANFESAAAAVAPNGGAAEGAAWTRPAPGARGGGGGSSGAFALDALTARASGAELSGNTFAGSGDSAAAAAAAGIFARVAALQRDVAARARGGAASDGAAAAAAAAAASAAVAAGDDDSDSEQAMARFAAGAAAAAHRRRPAAAASGAVWDSMGSEDEGALEGPSPEALRAAAAAAAATRHTTAAAAAASAAAAAAGAFAATLGTPAAFGQTLTAVGQTWSTTAASPASSWAVIDTPDDGTRHFIISAPPALAAAAAAAALGTAAPSDLAPFEPAALGRGVRVHRALYAEASALYSRLLPLVLDHLGGSGSPDHMHMASSDTAAAVSFSGGRVRFSGAGAAGGGLAALLTLMLAARGLPRGALAPAVSLDAAAPPLVGAPDLSEACSPGGCSIEEVGALVEDAAARGPLAALGLPPGAVMNVYTGAPVPELSSLAAGVNSSISGTTVGAAAPAEAAAAAATAVCLVGEAEASAPPAGGGAAAAAALAAAASGPAAALLGRIRDLSFFPEGLRARLPAALGTGSGSGGGAGNESPAPGPLRIVSAVGRVYHFDRRGGGSGAAAAAGGPPVAAQC